MHPERVARRARITSGRERLPAPEPRRARPRRGRAHRLQPTESRDSANEHDRSERPNCRRHRGAQGIGLAIARRLAASGARACLWDRDGAQLDQAVKAFDGGVATEIVDVANWDAVEKATASVVATLGRIDILVHSAGIAGRNAPLDEYDLDEWRRVIDIDLNGTFYVNRAVIPGMKAQNYGRIVNIASIPARRETRTPRPTPRPRPGSSA